MTAPGGERSRRGTAATVVAALVRKELRQLLPLALALGALLLFIAVAELVLSAPDQHRWSELSWLADPGLGAPTALLVLVLGVITAYNLLPGEHDQRTIELLYTLPVRRRTVFLVKYAVGAGLLAAFGALGTALGWLQVSLNPEPWERLRPPLMALELAADLVLPFIAVAYGMLLSYYRRLGWVLLAVVLGVLLLAERVWPALRLLNFSSLLEVEHHGTTPRVRWAAWALHLALAALALREAAQRWLEREQEQEQEQDRARASAPAAARLGWRRLGATLGLLALAAAGAVALVARVREAPPGEAPDDAAGPAAGAERGTRTRTTAHFRFSYRGEDQARALLVAGEADRAFQRVQSWLGAPALARIEADLTQTSNDHLGVAGWQRMRLDLRSPSDDALLLFVLYHETTHVFAEALGEGTPRARQAEGRFFAEGLAEYVAHELLDRPQQRQLGRQIAALARARFALRFTDLLDPAAFVARHDEYLFYPLGEVWVAALVETCGRAAPTRVLRGMASPALPQTLSGRGLWWQVLKEAGCDLDRVLARQEALLRALEPAARAALPVASGSVVTSAGDEVEVELRLEAPGPGPGPWPVTVRLRGGPASPPDHLRSATFRMAAGERRRVRVPAPPRTGRTFQLQVGARPGPDAPGFFSRWSSSR